jgi:RND superfamily putative drug exporter
MGGEQLRVTRGNARGQRLAVGDELFIGRAMGAEGSLGDDPGLSRRHARVARDADGLLTVEDLGSANGTFVNGHRIDAPQTLEAGDIVTMGATDLEVMRGEASAAVPAVARLMVVEGPASGRRLTDDDLVLGRTVEGEGGLGDDPELSRRHARVARDDAGRLLIEDLGSANGTFVNGVAVQAVRVLAVGDLVRVGQTTLRVVDVGEAPAASASDADLDEAPAEAATRVEPEEAPAPTTSRAGGLAELLIRGRAWILAAALALTVAGIVLGAPLPGLLRGGDDFADRGAQSSVKEGLLARVGGAEPGADAVGVVRAGGGRIGSPPLDALAAQADGDASGAAQTARRARSASAERTVARVARVMRADPNVARVLTYYQAATPTFVSKDRRATYVLAFLRDGSNARDTGKRLRAQLSFLPGVGLGGTALVDDAVGRRTGSGFAAAIAIALPLLYLVSLALLRGFIAALLPVITAIVAGSLTLLGLRLANAVSAQSSFTFQLVVGLGAGLAAAYAVLIVSRYREAASAHPPPEALRQALEAEGRTVVFSALAVAVALLSLVVFPQRALQSAGIGGAICALAAAVAAIIVLPALIAALGERVDALTPGGWQRPRSAPDPARERSGHWYRLSQWVVRRSGLVLVATTALLLAAGVPLLGLDSTGVGADVLAKDSSARQVASSLEHEFAVDPTATISLAVAAPPDAGGRLSAYTAELRRLPDVASVASPRRLDRGTWQIDVEPATPAFDRGSRDLVARIRAAPAPFPAALTGETAELVDGKDALGARLPFAIALLVLLTSAVLWLMTRSLILPIVSLVTSFLVVCATVGLVVLVRGELYTTQANLLAAVAFALSTACTLFVLARIREARAAGVDSDDAVSLGLERGAPIVTAAALLLAIAVGALAITAIDFVEVLVVGAVLGVLIEATIGRALLVPALLGLVGDRDW